MQDTKKTFDYLAKKMGVKVSATRLPKEMDILDTITGSGAVLKTTGYIAYNWILGPFANGYELSVIRHNGSYGGRSGKFEIAPCRGKDMLYYTAIAPTDCVKGWLTKREVMEAVEKMLTWDGTERFATDYKKYEEEA
jgi:hypothetical protein